MTKKNPKDITRKEIVEKSNYQDYYPHGHPKFIELCMNEMQLHNDKNHDYAAGGSPLGNFERVGRILTLYPNLKPYDPAMVALIYMLKQLDAYLWIKSNGHEVKVEGISDRLRDVSVYAKIINIIESQGELQCGHGR
jgi:hypothetical protein